MRLTFYTKGLDDDTGDEVAIKLEHNYNLSFSALTQEIDIYKTLTGGAGIPRVHWNGEVDNYHVMVFDLLGPSLGDLLDFCGRKFSLKTVLMVVNQLLYRLSHIHSKQLVHRDIKPDNILMGVGRRGNQVYITDMGIATEYRSSEGNYQPARPRLLGTEDFACRRGHLGLGE